MDIPARQAHTSRVFLWLFLTLNFFYILTSSGRVRLIDEVLPVFQTESIVQRGSTAVPQAVEARLFYGKFDRRGQPQAPYPPGPAIAAAPWYLAGRHVLLKLPGIPAGAQNLVTDFAIVLSNATFSALAVALAFVILARLGLAARDALRAALVIAFATPIFCHSAWYYSEPLTTALLLGAACALFTAADVERLPLGRIVVAGACLGATLWMRPTQALAVAVFMIAVALSGREDRWRVAALAAAVVALFGGAYLWRNSAMFGDPFDFGYPELAENGKRLNSFDTPLLTGLYGLLLSPGKSAFLFAPPLVLALAGLPKLWRENRGLAAAIMLTPLAYLLFYAKYTQYEGGYGFGPRYLVPGIVLLCLALGPAMRGASAGTKKILLALFTAGVLINAIGMATSPLEDQATGRYYDAHWNYRLDYNPLAGQGRLLLHYLTSPDPAPIGRGFDRWFVYLSKGGVATGTLAILAALTAAGAAFSAVRLRRALHGGDSRPPRNA